MNELTLIAIVVATREIIVIMLLVQIKKPNTRMWLALLLGNQTRGCGLFN